MTAKNKITMITKNKKKSSGLEYHISLHWMNGGDEDDYFLHSRAIEKLFPRSCSGSGMGMGGCDVSFYCKKTDTVGKIVIGLVQYANKHNLLDPDIMITFQENE